MRISLQPQRLQTNREHFREFLIRSQPKPSHATVLLSRNYVCNECGKILTFFFYSIYQILYLIPQLPIMKPADLQPPELALRTGRPLWSTAPSTTSSSSGELAAPAELETAAIADDALTNFNHKEEGEAQQSSDM